MLNIHSFLQGLKTGANKYNPVKNLSTECYKTCVMITAYSLIAIMLVLSSDSFYGTGSSVGSSYAKAETVSDAMVGAEETAQDAQIQPDEKEILNTLENKTTRLLTESRTEKAIGQAEQINQIIEEHRLQALTLNEQKELAEQRRLELIAEQEAKAKEEAKKAEQAKKKKEAKAAEEAKKIKLSSKEKEVLQRIVEAEATGEDIKGKMLVANVILNRVNSTKFPDSVSGVVFQKDGSTYQFSPIKDGRYWNVKISKATKKAVDRVLSGEDNSKGALYFSARSKADKSNMRWFDNHLTWLFQYGGHEFYR